MKTLLTSAPMNTPGIALMLPELVHVDDHFKMPDEYLKDSKILQTILCRNFAQKNEFRPLNEYRKCMREWGRDYLKAFLTDARIKFTQSEILDFETQHYGNL